METTISQDKEFQIFLKNILRPPAPNAGLAAATESIKQFIVGSIRQDATLSFAERPVVHLSESAARAEVERLAKLSPGKVYVYLELRGTAKVSADVQWGSVTKH